MKALTMEDLALGKNKVVSVEIPELDGTIDIRPVTLGDMAAIEDIPKEKQMEKTAVLLSRIIVKPKMTLAQVKDTIRLDAMKSIKEKMQEISGLDLQTINLDSAQKEK